MDTSIHTSVCPRLTTCSVIGVQVFCEVGCANDQALYAFCPGNGVDIYHAAWGLNHTPYGQSGSGCGARLDYIKCLFNLLYREGLERAFLRMLALIMNLSNAISYMNYIYGLIASKLYNHLDRRLDFR